MISHECNHKRKEKEDIEINDSDMIFDTADHRTGKVGRGVG